MAKIAEVVAAFEQYKIVPVFYHDDAATCVAVLQACYAAGIRVFEFTNRGQNAVRNFSAMLELKIDDMYLGVGTVKNGADAAKYTEMGADFIVSPIVDKEVADVCRGAQRLWVPGCMTPTEIATAEKLGAPLVKLFPGNILGPGFVKAIKPLFPDLKFMPTGGVEPTLNSIQSWLDAGVVCVGMGSNLLNKTTIDNKDWAALSEQLDKVMNVVQNTK